MRLRQQLHPDVRLHPQDAHGCGHQGGKTYQADTLKKWRFVFDDDSEVEFWMKNRAHQQDEKKVDLNTTNPENYDLYGRFSSGSGPSDSDLVVKIEVQ